MKTALISTGDELIKGVIADTNAAWMAGRLNEQGHRIEGVTVIGDDLDGLAAAFASAFARYDLIIVTGGLGPTDDDLTALAVSRATGLPLERRNDAVAQIEAAFARIARPMAPVNLKQADIPRGADVLRNEQGTAPGFAVTVGRCRAFFLPGPPLELHPMFEREVLSALPAPNSERHTAHFRCFGLGESAMQAALRTITDAHPLVRFSYRAAFPEVALTIESPVQSELDTVAAAASKAIGGAAFAREPISLPEALGRKLLAAGQSLACAESCTGGLICHSLTETKGSSAYFKGGVVAYDNAIKTSLLDVPEALLIAHGAVSEPVVCAMAEGARKRLGADLAVATSGIAGPTGATADKPVGLVHFAVADSRGIVHEQVHFHGWDRSRVKLAAAWKAMHLAFTRI